MKRSSSKNPADDLKETTCSPDAFRRDRGQKIVSFAFYGDLNSEQAVEKGYFEGIADNLNLLPLYYPGICSYSIIFVNVSKSKPQPCDWIKTFFLFKI